MKILVGDLSSEISPDFLQKIFQVYGEIKSVSITVDSSTNETIGEVEMPDAIEASNAVAAIDGNRIEGQVITINNMSEFINNDNPQLNSKESAEAESSPEKRKNKRRVVDSPLFKADKGIVIDRRNYTDRRNNPESHAENDLSSESS